ncbi:MAG: FtsW/RodA/SpoVE family cell cycle protein [Phycisphaerales bacterium]|jgi:cell division protein FtsW (lipid II flippase)|nr:FtsW/RodA/SpoVE family cell cycle protein [Phycisphaerales bacterium]
MLSVLVRGGYSGEKAVSSLRAANWAWLTIGAALALSVLGVYAIDVARASEPHAEFDLAATAWKQVVFLIIGMLAAVVVSLPHIRLVGPLSYLGMALSVGLLVFLLLPGVPTWLVTPRNGARGWINLGVVDLQPAELAKIASVLSAAWYMRFRDSHRELKGLIVPALFAGAPMALIILQPDLGSAMLFAPAILAMLVAAGARLRHIALVLGVGAVLVPASYPLMKEHQRARIVALIEQVRGDRSRADTINFQSFTAQTIAGAGEWGGVSDAKSRALVRYNGLPERHNDMVFSVIVNRFGFAGGVVTLGLYLVWTAGALLTAATCRDPFGRLVCVGLTAFILAQVFVNVGMNIGILPIIGITLPYVSYGGSSMLATWLMAGLVMNVALHKPVRHRRRSFEYDGDDA